METTAGLPPKQGLYDPRNEHDACGVGFVAHIKGKKSHEIVKNGITILNNLRHRGATGADPLHGDGAGLLTQIPDAFFREEMARQNVKLPKAGAYGVGMVFLPRNPAARQACVREIERSIANEGQTLLGWREVPVDDSTIGHTARSTQPVIRQVFVGAGRGSLDRDAFERKLYIIRKASGHAIRALGLSNAHEFYVPSFSHRTIVYKGMLLAEQVGAFFKDLSDKRFTSALCLAHQRFSTNTFPTWDLAHPFRFIAHNGEINTLRGNLNWIKSRQATIHSKLLGDDLDKIWPLIYDGQSDSASFDNALELLVMGGYPIAHAMMLMIPEAWAGNPLMDAKRRAFYEYNAALMEPWDGPAAVAFTDGKFIGATLDRNGLRPARYFTTSDDLIVMASEMGVLDIPQEKITKKWRLQPGKMLLVDIEHGRIVSDEELKRDLAAARPYQDWLDRTQMRLEDIQQPWEVPTPDTDKLLDRQQAFGYTQEDLKMLLTPMAVAGEEAIGSMGDDTPIAVLSNRAKPLYAYFRQLFAQVTNPPIDPIREQLVMSLVSFIGPRPNLLSPDSTEPVMRLEVSQPILTFEDMEKLRKASTFTQGHFKSEILTMCYPAEWGAEGMEPALAQLCADAEDAVLKGTNIIILTDRDVSAGLIPIPALLATAAVHHHLVRAGLRTRSGLVVETGSAREVHHFACLAGFGAEAIHPNVAFATILDMRDGLPQKVDEKEIVKRYIKAIGKGMLKVMSKMGISTYQSYCGAQIFEAVGLSQKFVDKYFTGTPTPVEGIGLAEVAEEAVRLHRLAYSDAPLYRNQLDPGGEYAYRIRGEAHMWTPDSIAKLQHATRAGNFATFKEYSRLIDDQSERLLTLRGLFRIKEGDTPVPIDEVEPAKEIVKRFATGAMSLGSISHEAHSTLAIAMNRIGGKSNTGEGGEDPIRYQALPNGDSMRSAIKQVAAGRFGVTTEYLVNADDLQIKMAQGAKPGEGGQLPGHKVSKYIAKVRHTVPGVGLISPPPHHDIYSIEDLAQLIHDLKNVNPASRVSVKLVSEIGVGTVAAGVAKAKADHVTISGHDGGTGASPLSSVKYAGSPWEIGLAETQQTLVLNKLRARIAVQADGQMKTGRDVVIGALLGADEFGFATAPLVVQGCIMMRKCHLNTCPVGIATQDPELIRKFTGKPEHVINYFFFIAEEVREWMARMGFRRFEEMIGRVDMLDVRRGIEHWKARGLDFSRLFYCASKKGEDIPLRQTETQDHGLAKALDHELIDKAAGALASKKPVAIESRIYNRNRTVGAMLSGEVARRYGHAGLADDTIHVNFKGTAGQSFGAWLAHGVTFELEGDANDYVGKGLSGGRIIIYPPKACPIVPEDNIIIGNTVMYGAIAGEGYFRGVAGERFCVRNSGATAVVEGVGDHGCEYMTGGTVVVLGKAGRNFAAGMSGGIAYVLDEEGDFTQRCNMAMVELEPIPEEQTAASATGTLELEGHGKVKIDHVAGNDDEMLKGIIQRHLLYTGSDRARRILENWAAYLPRFVKVMPLEYRRALAEMAQEKLRNEQPAVQVAREVRAND
ncbi:MAG TPA: glutamate synthase large subunit [Usitatibacter sp.]|nr:glutamate synthase large subunit [Usitatibacter sp.]